MKSINSVNESTSREIEMTHSNIKIHISSVSPPPSVGSPPTEPVKYGDVGCNLWSSNLKQIVRLVACVCVCVFRLLHLSALGVLGTSAWQADGSDSDISRIEPNNGDEWRWVEMSGDDDDSGVNGDLWTIPGKEKWVGRKAGRQGKKVKLSWAQSERERCRLRIKQTHLQAQYRPGFFLPTQYSDMPLLFISVSCSGLLMTRGFGFYLTLEFENSRIA